MTADLHPGGKDGTTVPTGTAAAGGGVFWAAAAAAALSAAAVVAAALVATAAVVTTAASLYIERRATPATEKGVRGKPIIASASLTNPSLNGDSGRKSAIDIKTSAIVSAMDIKNVFIDLLLF
jgi:hypothetical protein